MIHIIPIDPDGNDGIYANHGTDQSLDSGESSYVDHHDRHQQPANSPAKSNLLTLGRRSHTR